MKRLALALSMLVAVALTSCAAFRYLTSMIDNFDVALRKFEADVRVVHRDGGTVSRGSVFGSEFSLASLALLACTLALRVRRRRAAILMR